MIFPSYDEAENKKKLNAQYLLAVGVRNALTRSVDDKHVTVQNANSRSAGISVNTFGRRPSRTKLNLCVFGGTSTMFNDQETLAISNLSQTTSSCLVQKTK